MFKQMSRYRKTVVALLGGVATWGATAAADGIYDQTELWGLLFVVSVALGVYQAPNNPVKGTQGDPRVSETDH